MRVRPVRSWMIVAVAAYLVTPVATADTPDDEEIPNWSAVRTAHHAEMHGIGGYGTAGGFLALGVEYRRAITPKIDVNFVPEIGVAEGDPNGFAYVGVGLRTYLPEAIFYTEATIGPFWHESEDAEPAIRFEFGSVYVGGRKENGRHGSATVAIMTIYTSSAIYGGIRVGLGDNWRER